MWKYKIIYGLGVAELTQNVNQALQEGWAVEGSLVAVRLGTNIQFFQPVTMWVEDGL